MTRYIIKRLLYMIPMLFLVVLLVFLIMSFTPGDPASANLPLTTPAAVKEAYNESVGYSASLPVRFLTFLRGLLHGNVPSYSTGDNVFAELARRIPMTLRLGLISFSIAALLGVAMGILSAVKQYSFLDTTLTVFSVLFASIPSFFIAILMLLYFAVNKGLLPSFGMNDGIRSYILPITTMVIGSIPILSRMTRSAMLGVLKQDYIRTARSKGVPERSVIWKHALKNASFPIITLLLSGLAGILGGSVIVESIFSLPGVGMYMLDAIHQKNVPGVMICALLLSAIFILAMVLMDICFALIDPKVRVRYQK
ncbi:MAG: ABC transporter permease [Firmicutes bacterium]|nr:ABC transporter permease [Bacillota bacterium]MBQ6663758.1 ABC transporter permease [Bacillota bacterium]MCR4710673.1 ABC transporter permease [Clostridia bacterium]